MKTVIFDLDGTLALIDDRRQLATRPNGKLDWDLFFAPENIKLDQPNIPVIAVYNLLQNEGYRMVILSGRDAISKTATMSWLRNNGIHFDELRMRPQGTFTPDDVLKKGWLDELGAENIFCVFDDRDKVVKMWRDNGLTCFQVNYGNF
jgi:hypothetical protein